MVVGGAVGGGGRFGLVGDEFVEIGDEREDLGLTGRMTILSGVAHY